MVKQYQATKQGGPFALVNVSKPSPSAEEVCIRPKAVALNPLDWKNLKFGFMVQAWPAVFGIDGAGVVESVGERVTSFKAGDEVFSLAGMEPKAGAFQEIYTVPEHQVAKKPSNLSFEEATSLPICYLTAAASIVLGLKIPLPSIGKPDPITPPPSSILVLGASSAVGAIAVQLLRLALGPSPTIITTSSPAHHTQLLSLGASKCLDRSAQDNPTTIKSATPGGNGVDAILDPVTAAASQPSVFEALNPAGPKLYSQVVTGQNPQVPEGVKARQVFGPGIFGVPGGMQAIRYLAQLVEEGKFQLPVKVEVVGNGLESIEGGLKRLMRGVSGMKLVVSL
ncbi:MAG: hypothetical protein Q9160_005528 [Pyrenula sp. 1 TL-2023]